MAHAMSGLSRTAKLTPRKAARHERILDVACRLTGLHGHDGVSMRTIAAESGTTEKTLYNVYGSKNRLIATAARERSARLFEAAVEAAPEGGWPMLRTFARMAAELTLADPPMARALATVLLEHPDLVGLESVYEGRVALALEQMAEAGDLEPTYPHALLIRLIRLGVTAAVLFWSHDELSDAELEPYISTRIVETLLPYVPAGRQVPLRDLLGRAREKLADACRSAVSGDL